MKNTAKILCLPGRQWMLDVEEFNYDGYIGDILELEDLKGLLHVQLALGWSVAFEAYVNDEYSLFLALAGVVPDEDTGKAEIWFLPAVDMPKHARHLLRVMPKTIKTFLSLSGSTSGFTLIDPNNEKFKKFAKLCKFDYSSTLEINGIKFEEWKFGG